jgi:hypothetical protein
MVPFHSASPFWKLSSCGKESRTSKNREQPNDLNDTIEVTKSKWGKRGIFSIEVVYFIAPAQSPSNCNESWIVVPDETS